MLREHSLVKNGFMSIILNRKNMKQKTWMRVAAVILAALLLWWLFWAILIDEDENALELPNTEVIE